MTTSQILVLLVAFAMLVYVGRSVFGQAPKINDGDANRHGTFYELHDAGKQFINEKIEVLAKDTCMPTGWYSEAIQSANASDDFRHDVTIVIPEGLALSGKREVIKLRRSHFVRWN